eukprot:Gb_11802 [translate_table: standard]
MPRKTIMKSGVFCSLECIRSALTMSTKHSIGRHFMQSKEMLSVFVFLMMILTRSNGAGTLACPKCGNTSVPYPLSTGDGCGEPDYRINCNANKQLEFKALNGSSYSILRIIPQSQRLVIEPSDLVNDTCTTEDIKSGGVYLNDSLPFNITSSNTIMYLNCNPLLLQSPLNCSSNSLCHEYIDQVEGAKACRNNTICCTFRAGGSSTSDKIRVRTQGCKAYTSVVNYNPALPASQWSYGIELQWVSPREPVCRSQKDCGEKSACSRDPTSNSGGSRCFCTNDFHWDPISGTCAKNVPVCNDPDGCGSTNRGPLIAGLVSGLCAAIAAAVLLLMLYRKKRHQMEVQAKLAKERAEILALNSGGTGAKLFTRKEMKAATNGFSEDRVLGIGGFGEVYKGVLKDGTIVAVKAAKVGNIKGTEQVLNEVRILSQVNHRCLVRLLGCCVDTEQPLMIYEYIPNGTLYDHLHTSKGVFLDWKTRLNIAFQTAEALAYLHSAAFPPIYHRDVKSSNILLDNKLNAKVSDFGLSRLAETDMSHISTCAQGTLGYLDPEYYRNYQLTDKSDVYSFGVVLLELVTSQKAIDFSRGPDDVNLAVCVLEKSEDGKIMDVVDRKLTANASQVVLDTIKALAFLALGCLQEKRQDRPGMKEVAEEIQYIISIEAAGIVEDHDNSPLPSKSDESDSLVSMEWAQ